MRPSKTDFRFLFYTLKKTYLKKNKIKQFFEGMVICATNTQFFLFVTHSMQVFIDKKENFTFLELIKSGIL